MPALLFWLLNKVIINDKQISQLSKLLNPYTDTVQVSLDGASSEIYGKIRQTNLFDKVVDNIEKLINANIRVDVGAVVNTINYKGLMYASL